MLIGNERFKLIHGDCLDVLKTIPDNSVDAVITDPPAGISFAGQQWDSDKGGRDKWIAWLCEIMIEVNRVLKPGAHGLVWALPRTSHWTGFACENAGFEIRDSCIHIFGTGFPKSLNVSKAIDKLHGAEREIIGDYEHWARQNRSYVGSGDPFNSDIKKHEKLKESAAATDDAKQWDGWGSNLKPAHEVWWLIRKPLSEKNITLNVLKHGVGAINIDGCRIESGLTEDLGRKTNGINTFFKLGAKDHRNRKRQGRYPANVVIDDSKCVNKLFPVVSCGSVKTVNNSTLAAPNMFGLKYKVGGGFSDKGSAARFFYCAKSSPSDRNEGLADKKNTHNTVKNTNLMAYWCRLITPPNGIILDCFMGSGSTGKSAVREGYRFIGIEKELDYFEIAQKRIAHELNKDFIQTHKKSVNKTMELDEIA